MRMLRYIATISVTLIMAVVAAHVAAESATRAKVVDRDRTGTTVGSKKMSGSQTLNSQVVASLVSFQAEGTGLEPACDSAANDNAPCVCEKCHQARAALALHSGCFKWLEMASSDADLQRVIAAWGDLPKAVRRGVTALVESQK